MSLKSRDDVMSKPKAVIGSGIIFIWFTKLRDESSDGLICASLYCSQTQFSHDIAYQKVQV